jgi:hypothetical protein
MHDISILRDIKLSTADLSTMNKLEVDEEWNLITNQYHLINTPYLIFLDEFEKQKRFVRTLKWTNNQIWHNLDKTPKEKRAEYEVINEQRKVASAILDELKGYYREYRQSFREIAARKHLIQQAWDRLRNDRKAIVQQKGLTKSQEYLMNRRIKVAANIKRAEERRLDRSSSTSDIHERKMSDIRDRLYNRGKYAPHSFVKAIGDLCSQCNYPPDRFPHIIEEGEDDSHDTIAIARISDADTSGGTDGSL